MIDQTPVYPIPRPATGDDHRFCYALSIDVAAVLHRHGYPPVLTGADLARVQQALFTLIYHQEATR
jgi:hypothetical protein